MTLGLVELLADDAVSAEAALRRGYEPLLEMRDTSFCPDRRASCGGGSNFTEVTVRTSRESGIGAWKA